MAAHILDGRALAEEIRAAIRPRLARLAARGYSPHLLALRAGEDPAAVLYAKAQARACEREGIGFSEEVLPAGADTAQVRARLDAANRDPKLSGILVVKPFGPGVDFAALRVHIDPLKDVEGIHPQNTSLLGPAASALPPCTAAAAVELAHAAGFPFRGRHVVIVGAGETVGTPLALLALQRWATVTVCHIYTERLADHTSRADGLFVAAGRPRLIRGDMVKPGAVVIDIGINRIADVEPDGATRTRIVGDVDFESVGAVAGHLTPVPGGVGPLTVALLLRNIVAAAERQRG
ncbi:MAG: bifunctional 5,10-methylenetetrahydrofolate dehydrogenase/5,10-methenyltetrahydrofolate cyclohydrolase [Planctomycetes bacterium]|nr:bifunctional 5,10-methylenetetrahydrofolate dehydrogenase/5,10-methenyltetrahydrofolate cyclohydrolase [Planctomycetota bacterium]